MNLVFSVTFRQKPMTRFLTLCLPAFLPLALGAQTHADCASALEICNKQTLHLAAAGAGNDPTELNNATCFLNGVPVGVESNSVWIRFTAAQGGSLWFIIRPDTPSIDLDFVVFRLPAGDCANKELLRCMAAGDFQFPSSCMGPTGLLPGQTDISEDAGCTDPDDDNFLAPLELQAGETCVLAINNFTSVLDSFTVEFCGSALLGCETEICNTLLNATDDQPEIQAFHVYPNPTTTGTMQVEWKLSKPERVTSTLYNAVGAPIRTVAGDFPSGTNAVSFETAGLPAGLYVLTLDNGHSVQSKRVQILR